MRDEHNGGAGGVDQATDLFLQPFTCEGVEQRKRCAHDSSARAVRQAGVLTAAPAVAVAHGSSALNNTFCLLLKVVNSQAHGPDVVEIVADVTRAARTPVPAPRNSHRVTG
ncbi:hypothetical protein [Streptomyces sp. NPDC088246]|uniref:hypothetical protein n=1 Tax=Streptomyces sp. NPDC088246 TaxID=3365842 RepID=UPI003815C708